VKLQKATYQALLNLAITLPTFVAVGTGAKDYKYTGLSMTDAHDPAKNSRMNGKASSADFDAFV